MCTDGDLWNLFASYSGPWIPKPLTLGRIELRHNATTLMSTDLISYSVSLLCKVALTALLFNLFMNMMRDYLLRSVSGPVK